MKWIESRAAELEKMEKVFFPFWIGRYRCVGEGLALVQMRLVVTKVLARFKIQFAEGWDENRVRPPRIIEWTVAN